MKQPAVLFLGLKLCAARVVLMDHSLLFRSLPIPWPPLALMAIVSSPRQQERLGWVLYYSLGANSHEGSTSVLFSAEYLLTHPLKGGF